MDDLVKINIVAQLLFKSERRNVVLSDFYVQPVTAAVCGALKKALKLSFHVG